MATNMNSRDENAYILGQSQSDMSETSSVSDTRHLMENKDDDRLLSSIPMTSFNFINSIIGSGIIGVPYALRQAGFGLGIILLIVVAVTTDASILLLIEGGKVSNTDTYQDLVLVACGKPGFFVLSTLQFLYPFIAMISYNVIIGDTITKIILRIGGDAVYGTVLANRQFIIFLATVLVTLPLSMYRNISRLSKWAFISLVLVVFIIICICIKLGVFAKSIEQTPDAWNFANYNITQAIGIMAFAYMCHHNTFLIHSSMENPTSRRWGFVTHFSILFCMVMMLIFGIIGYMSFTGFAQGDLLENYCHEDDLMNAARMAFAITIMLTYPVECFVTREVVENAFFASSQPSPLWRHFGVTVVVVILSGAVSMTTDCLGIVLELNGVLAACPLAFIIPPLCVMRLRQEALFSKVNIVPICIFVFGTLVASIGLIMAILNISEGLNCSHGKEMEYCLNPVGPGNLSGFTTGLNKSML